MMAKNDSVRGSRLSQRTILTADNSEISKLLNFSFDSSGNLPTCPTPEQSFLFDLWTSFEQIQDSIYDQSSPEYQLFETVNPILFDLWIRTGQIHTFRR